MRIEILLFLIMGVCAVIDGLKREIPIVIVWIGIIVAVILRLCGTIGDGSAVMAALSVIPGVMLWMISFVTRKSRLRRRVDAYHDRIVCRNVEMFFDFADRTYIGISYCAGFACSPADFS